MGRTMGEVSWYWPMAVHADLDAELVCCWSAQVEGTHLLVPDGCVDVLWIAGRGVTVCGPETSAWSFTMPVDTDAVGIRFRPGVAPGVLSASGAELRDSRVELADLFGSSSAGHLVDRLDHATDSSDRLELLQSAARRWAGQRRRTDELSIRIGAALGARSWTVGELADAASLTERQLRRRCLDAFGYGPSTLRAILRLQRFMRLARARPHAGLAALAADAGYADQAHLTRECRKIAAQTPRELLCGEAPDWQGGAALFRLTDRDDDGGDVRSVQDRRSWNLDDGWHDLPKLHAHRPDPARRRPLSEAV